MNKFAIWGNISLVAVQKMARIEARESTGKLVMIETMDSDRQLIEVDKKADSRVGQ